MTSKLEKLRAERRKNSSKITTLQARNVELDQKITELENIEIVGLVRSMNLTPEQLAVLLQGGGTGEVDSHETP